MCGIAGAWSVSPVLASREVVERQLALLDHRGPDSAGVFATGHGVIGQARLAIIDLDTGDPPITGCDKSSGVVLNGEIYNFEALRKQLAGDGHIFRSTGDTEVIAHLAEQVNAVELARRLDGMFAFAVWTPRRGQLILGRDRFGKKPLYYWTDTAGTLVFASEIKALLAHPAVPKRLWEPALSAYLTFGYVPTPHTFFEGIRSLPPGHVLVADNDGVELKAYWSPLALESRPPASFGEAAAEVRRRLEEAVSKRLIADVPLGAFLSGGIDSSAVVALMAQSTSRPVRTFSIGFEDNEGFDERPFARLVADRYHTDHTEFVVQPDKAELIEKLVWHHDQPFGDSSALPTYLLAELTSQHVTVALSGDGGDEAFGGYERFAAGIVTTQLARVPGAPRLASHAVRRLPRGTPRRASLERMLADVGGALPTYRRWISYVPDHWKLKLVGRVDDWGTADYASAWDKSAGLSPLGRLLHLNISTYLLDDLLPKVDRMAMANGLEVRSPFLDPALFRFATALPDRYLVRGTTLKRVLKAAMKDELPHEILQRGKKGFGIPLDRWFRTDLRPLTDHLLRSSNSRLHQHIDRGAVEDLLTTHALGKANLGHAIWTLVTLEVFLRQQGW